jgi:IstB-like ATP binding protein
MQADAMVATMKSLKLHGMAQAVAELAQQQGPAFKQAQPVLDDLLKAEVAEREVRSISYQLKTARFPAYRDLAGFKFEDSAVDVALVKALHGCDFVADSHNVVFIGGPGTPSSSSISSRARRPAADPDNSPTGSSTPISSSSMSSATCRSHKPAARCCFIC